MRREEITERFCELESELPVQSYAAHGVRVWPLLRMALYGRLHREAGTPGIAAPVAGRARRAGAWAGAVLRDAARRVRGAPAPWLRPADCVLLTYTDRRVVVDGEPCHSLATPLAAALAEAGCTLNTWELGGAAPSGLRSPSALGDALRRASLPAKLRSRVGPRAAPPSWSRELLDACRRTLGCDVAWPELRAAVAQVLRFAAVFEGWLREARPALVFLDCWYSPEGLAATLAARRLGLPSVDLQHGLQGAGHPAYAGWMREPEAGYETTPDHYWVWGDADRDSLLAANDALFRPDRVLAGGNLWLERWRDAGDTGTQREIERARSALDGATRSVLVTLQKEVEPGQALLDAIARSPRDWRWWVRPHRSSAGELAAIEARFRGLGHPGVRVREAASLPLYALLSVVDGHVTGFSTCAVEALCFDRETLLIHPSGRAAFREPIEAGLMQYVDSADALLRRLGEPRSVAAGAIREHELTRRLFAPAKAGQRALQRLLAGAGARGDAA